MTFRCPLSHLTNTDPRDLLLLQKYQVRGVLSRFKSSEKRNVFMMGYSESRATDTGLSLKVAKAFSNSPVLMPL